MAYAVGDTISNSDYNGLLNNTASGTPNAGVAARGINYIAGTGVGVYGLGQTELGSLPAAGDTITAAQWNSLFTFMNNIQNHTNITALTSTTAAAAGDVIAIKAALETDLTALAAAVAGGSTLATAVSEGPEDLSLVASAVFDTSHIVEASFTFDGGDEARWFFNAGGKLRVKITNAATNSTSIDTSYSALITALGNFDMAATTSARSGSGETLTTDGSALGYYDLTTSYQTLIKLTQDDGTYSGSHSITVEARTSVPHADGRDNNGEVVTLRVSIATTETGAALSDFTPNNTSSVNAEANAGGPTDVAFHTMDPTTVEGLATVYTNIVVASVSNNIANND
jgi:hypothetical protein